MQFLDKDKIMPEYIHRTLVNLSHIENIEPHPYEVTQLVNSFVGLLILPKETAFDNISNEVVSNVTLQKIINTVKVCKDKHGRDENKNLKNIIKHMRNGICHFRLEFLGSNQIESIKITDMSYDDKIKTFEATFDIALLKTFVLEFANNMSTKMKKERV